MSEDGSELLEDIEANKLTIEELEAIVAELEQVTPLRRTAETALKKMRWHIATAHNEGDE